MPRLVAFGCSYTKGWDLHDQLVLNDYNSSPSKFAYPSVLAKLLNYDIDNRSQGGHSNAEIMYDILNYNFMSDDLCLIGYSHFGRLLFNRFDLSEKKPEKISSHNPNKDQIINITDKDIFFKNYLIISYIDLFLQSKNIKSFGVVWCHTFFKNTAPSYLKINNLLNYNPNNDIIDKAGDNRHPGIKSHSLIADKIYDIIKEKL